MEYPFVIEKKKTPFLAWSASLKIYKAVPLSSANRETFQMFILSIYFFSLALNMIHKNLSLYNYFRRVFVLTTNSNFMGPLSVSNDVLKEN